jgi:hypothetical protein
MVESIECCRLEIIEKIGGGRELELLQTHTHPYKTTSPPKTMAKIHHVGH